MADETTTNGATATGEAPNEEQVMNALRSVYDPELGISIVDLGLVYGVTMEENRVNVDMTLTTPACPLGPVIKQQAYAVLTSHFDWVQDVDINLVWTPRWDPYTMASEEAKAELGIW
jgi:metal-sulfur cluster biosynthetic enzyme